MTHLLMVLGFVIYVNGGAEFFTSTKVFTDPQMCDNFAAEWAEDTHNDPSVDKVYAQCVEMPGQGA